MKTIALLNQKGGVGKSTTAFSLGAGLARLGQRVVLIDADPQANLTQMMGWQDADALDCTLATALDAMIADTGFSAENVILHHSDNLDLVPSSILLANTEVSLVSATAGEHMLKSFIEAFAGDYDYCIIDCMPALGMLNINAMVAANSLIIPVVPHFLPVKGLEQLVQSIAKVKRNRWLNPDLEIDGILLTMVDGGRTRLERAMVELIADTYGDNIRIFDSQIPKRQKAAEMSLTGKSIFEYDASGNVAAAYDALARIINGGI